MQAAISISPEKLQCQRQYRELQETAIAAFEAIGAESPSQEQIDVAIAIRMKKQGEPEHRISKVLCQSPITQRISQEQSPLDAVTYVHATQKQAQDRLDGLKAKQSKQPQEAR